MAKKDKDCFIAVYEEFYGKGSTLELAFADLKSNGPSGIDLEEVEFYESVQLDVELKLTIVTDDVC